MSSNIELNPRTIWQQQDVECCTSCAIATCLEALHDYDVLSPIFHYHRSRVRYDRGLNPEHALDLARTYGFCLQALHDQQLNRAGLRVRPSSRATRDGTSRRLRHVNKRLYVRLGSRNRANQMRSALERGHPTFLVLWPDSGYRQLAQAGVYEWHPTRSSRQGLLHTVAVLGYHANTKRFVAQDSRGDQFGRGGQWFLAARHCDARSIHEGWEIRDR